MEENTSDTAVFPRRIIHLVDSLANINMGIWMPIVNQILAFRQIGIEAIIISLPDIADNEFGNFREQYQLKVIAFRKPSLKKITNAIVLDQKQDLIISHGCWRFPSRIGFELGKLNYKRIAIPHAMLMPWCLGVKAFKKNLYFHLFEKKYLRKANYLQAVSTEEQKVLQGFFPSTKTTVLPNYIAYNEAAIEEIEAASPIVFLFLGRLHAVKNLFSLVEAWVNSSLNNAKEYELRLIGKDEGELKKILPLCSKSNNIKILGPLYGTQKKEALKQGRFFILPSLSEGMPTALLEAMSFGLIPICTAACNLPQIFEEKIGFEIGTESASIGKTLENCKNLDKNTRKELRIKAQKFVLHTFGASELNQAYLFLFKKFLFRP